MGQALLATENTLLAEDAVDSYMNLLKSKQKAKKNTIKTFSPTLNKFKDLFSGTDIREIPATDIVTFLQMISEDWHKPATKSGRKGHVSALYGHVIETYCPDLMNPCSSPLVKKLFRVPTPEPPMIYDKEIIDEIIYTAAKGKERLFIECMARGAMRIGEVHQGIRPRNMNLGQGTITIEDPKSGRSGELVYLPKKLLNRIDEYIREERIDEDSYIFPFSYTTGFRMVKRLAKIVGVQELSPHDFRRFAATQASRNGMPLEIVSKVVLRHANLETTQRYLGKVDAVEANRMVETYMG